MLLIWERSPRERERKGGEGMFPEFLSFPWRAALRPVEQRLEPSKRREENLLFLSRCGGESPSVFIGRQRDGRRLPRMLTKEFSSSSSTPPRTPPPPPPLPSSRCCSSLRPLFFFLSLVPLWNILLLPSCTRVATANLTLWDYVWWESMHTHIPGHRASTNINTDTRSQTLLPYTESSWFSVYVRASPFPLLPWQVQLIFLFGIRVPPHRAQIMSRISVRYLSYAELRLRTGGRELFLPWTDIFVSSRARKNFPACQSRLQAVAFIKYLRLRPRALPAEYTRL